MIIVKPSFSLFNLYALLPLGSAFFMATAYIATRYLMDTESSVTVIFYYSIALLFTSLLFLPNNFIFPEVSHLTLLFSLGVIGSLGHYFLSQAAKYGDCLLYTSDAADDLLCVVLFFFGLKYLLFAENQALLHTAPIIATILALPFLGEKIKLTNLLAIFFWFYWHHDNCKTKF